MMKNQMSNIPALSANDAIKNLTKLYSNTTNFLDKIPSVMLWGPPGVGKSQLVKEVACNLGKELNKRVEVTDVRLILFNPVDLRGIPSADVNKEFAIWLKPKIFNMDESDDVLNILFLDEISAATLSVQAAAYQITLDKRIGEHKLPKNCIVIAAGNRVTDKSVAYQMPKALANRLLHFEIEPDFNSWNTWAISQGIHPYVLGFIKFKPDRLYCDEVDGYNGLAYPTPRTFEMVSNILNYVSDDFKEVYSLISGVIGKACATEMRTWTKIYSKLPNIEDIFNGKENRVPKELDTLYALTSSMIKYARLYKDDMVKIGNSIRYANLLPPEFSVMLLKDYLYLEDNYKNKLLKLPEYLNWMKTKGKLLDATK